MEVFSYAHFLKVIAALYFLLWLCILFAETISNRARLRVWIQLVAHFATGLTWFLHTVVILMLWFAQNASVFPWLGMSGMMGFLGWALCGVHLDHLIRFRMGSSSLYILPFVFVALGVLAPIPMSFSFPAHAQLKFILVPIAFAFLAFPALLTVFYWMKGKTQSGYMTGFFSFFTALLIALCLGGEYWAKFVLVPNFFGIPWVGWTFFLSILFYLLHSFFEGVLKSDESSKPKMVSLSLFWMGVLFLGISVWKVSRSGVEVGQFRLGVFILTLSLSVTMGVVFPYRERFRSALSSRWKLDLWSYRTHFIGFSLLSLAGMLSIWMSFLRTGRYLDHPSDLWIGLSWLVFLVYILSRALAVPKVRLNTILGFVSGLTAIVIGGWLWPASF